MKIQTHDHARDHIAGLPNSQNSLEPALDPQFSTALDPEVPE